MNKDERAIATTRGQKIEVLSKLRIVAVIMYIYQNIVYVRGHRETGRDTTSSITPLKFAQNAVKNCQTMARPRALHLACKCLVSGRASFKNLNSHLVSR